MTQSPHVFTTELRVPFTSRYLLHLPEGHAERDDWPLVVFLHGSGERGDDIDLVRKHGLPRLLSEGLDLRAVVLSPQCPAGQLWSTQVHGLVVLIERLTESHRVDRSRIVVTGLSLGGAGACELVGYAPDRFAGLAPICGPWTDLFVTAESARVPTWVFHGDADDVVPVTESYQLVEAIRGFGGDPRLTVYPGVGHNSWDAAYGDPELLMWLLRQRRVD